MEITDIKTTIFNIINKIKINLKTRFDNNDLYYNDIIITIDKSENKTHKFIYVYITKLKNLLFKLNNLLKYLT